MLRLALVLPLLLSGCDRLPESFPPPAQRASLETSGGLGHFVAMNDPAAEQYLVQGFRNRSEGPWRWAHEHPVMRFALPPMQRARFTMTLNLPDQNLRLTGPLTLRVRVNGHALDPVRYDKPGEWEYSQPVPGQFLKAGVNLVAIDPDAVAEPNPGEKLSFVLIRAGFVE